MVRLRDAHGGLIINPLRFELQVKSRESELSILTIQYRSSTLSRPDQHNGIMRLESAIRLMFGSPCVSCSYCISHETSSEQQTCIIRSQDPTNFPNAQVLHHRCCNRSIVQRTVSRSLNRMCSHQNICSHISTRSCRISCRMSHRANNIRDVQKTVFILVFFVYAAHQGSSRR